MPTAELTVAEHPHASAGVNKGHEPLREHSKSTRRRVFPFVNRNPASSVNIRSLFGDQAADHERVIANLRLFFSTSLLLAVYLGAIEPGRSEKLTYGVLWAYVLYSLGLFLAARLDVPLRRAHILLIHAADIVAVAAFTVFAEGATGPLIVAAFGFVLLAAGYRWGFRETVLTGVVSALLLNANSILLLTSTSPGNVDRELVLDSFLIRMGYLVLFTVMIGYLAERQRVSRAELVSSAAAAERARLARELHDGVIQALLGMKMRLEVMRRAGSLESAAVGELEENETLLAREVVNLRMLMFELSPSDEKPPELASRLHDLAERFEHASGIATRFVTSGVVPDVSPRACHEIVQIVQESLVNVHKHSGARNALVRLSEKSDHRELTVEDDGRGFEFEGRATEEALDPIGKGPRIIRERVRLLGGSLAIESTPGVGAKLTVTLPLQL
jgi:signal transduction histidine kinase